MPDRFIAFDVEEGDAFFLEIEQDGTLVRFLVDGGINKPEFHKQFRAVTGVQELDVMVCTHNDADHVLGLVDHLEYNPPLTTKEVWLPADWLPDVTSFLQDPASYLWKCFEALQEVSDRELLDLLRRLETQESEMPAWEDTHTEEVLLETPALDSGMNIDPEKANELALAWAIRYIFYHSNPLYYERLLYRMAEKRNVQVRHTVKDCLLAYLTKVQQLSELVSKAITKKCHLRWFAYDEHHPKGPRQDFVPLNAREIGFPKNVVLPASKLGQPQGPHLLQYFLKRTYPTKINRRALVFCLVGTDSRPPVLFSSDSDYAFAIRHPGRICWQDGMLITTPHHGANANVRLSELFKKQRSGQGVPSVWVRSDMPQGALNTTRPSIWYRKLPASAQRYCTICSLPNAQYQTLHLAVVQGSWSIAPGRTAQTCQCP